jgi:hypothetical protein
VLFDRGDERVVLGRDSGRNRPAIVPSGAMRNFSKFHWMSPASPSASAVAVSSV